MASPEEDPDTPIPPRRPGPVALLRSASRSVLQVRSRLLLLIIVSQLVLTFVAFPVSRWILREALRANGMYAIDMQALQITSGFPLTVAMLIGFVLLSLWVLVLQFSAYLVLLRYPDLSWKELAAKVQRIARKVAKPSSALFALYLLVIVPLSGFGFMSAVIGGVAIPNFITGELEKQPIMRVAVAIFYLLVAYLNLRLAATMPIFAFSARSGTQSMRTSWHMTRGLRSWPILVAVLAAIIMLGASLALLFGAVLVPTTITDHLARGASPVVAGISLAIGQILALVATGLTVATVAAILTGYAASNSDPLGSASPGARRIHTRTPGRIGWAIMLMGALALGLINVPAMYRISDQPETIVLAHRGFTDDAVENTIEALEAASAAHIDMVEFDTMQTKDGQFVVMHDANLNRLTGKNLDVKDLTLDELTAMTVHDQAGHTGHIPSLVEYMSRAKELGQPLLIEIKTSGAETDTHVQDLLAVLEDNDLLQGNMFHTLDASTAKTLKALRPDETVGYIMPFAGLGVPDTTADFLVLEESSATPEMQQMTSKAGLGYLVWTVDSQDAINLRMRQGVDGIITDHPDWAMATREAMQRETGLADRLADMMTSFVLIG